MLDRSMVSEFWRNGYLVVPEVLSTDEVESIRGRIRSVLDRQLLDGLVERRGDYTLRGDLSTHEALWTLLVDDRVLSCVAALLDARPLYFRFSNAHVGSGARGWHKDNRYDDRFDPSGDDWAGRYPLIRAGIYLQDHVGHSGGLSVRTGSHVARTTVRSRASRAVAGPWYGTTGRPAARKAASGLYGQGRAVHVDSAVGDLVLWNMRITHSGNTVRLRGAPHLKLSPRLERGIPRRAAAPEECERTALFLTYGASSPHLDRYLAYLRQSSYFDHLVARPPCAEFLHAVERSSDLDYVDPSPTGELEP